MRKFWVLAGVALAAILALSACGGGQRDADTAMQFLNALNQGDVDAARGMACPDHADDLMEGLATVGEDEREEWVFQNISCQPYSGDVLCRYQIVQEREDNTQETLDYDVTFEMEGGKICGFADTVEEAAP